MERKWTSVRVGKRELSKRDWKSKSWIEKFNDMKIIFSILITIIWGIMYGVSYMFFTGYYFGRDDGQNIVGYIINPIPYNGYTMIFLGVILTFLFCITIYIAYQNFRAMRDRNLLGFTISMIFLATWIGCMWYALIYIYLGRYIDIGLFERVTSTTLAILIFSVFLSGLWKELIGFLSLAILIDFSCTLFIRHTISFEVITWLNSITLVIGIITLMSEEHFRNKVVKVMTFVGVLNIIFIVVSFFSIFIKIDHGVFNVLAVIISFMVTILIYLIKNEKKIKHKKDNNIKECKIKLFFEKIILKARMNFIMVCFLAIYILFCIIYFTYGLFATGKDFSKIIANNEIYLIEYFDGEKKKRIYGTIVAEKSNNIYISTKDKKLVIIKANNMTSAPIDEKK